MYTPINLRYVLVTLVHWSLQTFSFRVSSTNRYRDDGMCDVREYLGQQSSSVYYLLNGLAAPSTGVGWAGIADQVPGREVTISSPAPSHRLSGIQKGVFL